MSKKNQPGPGFFILILIAALWALAMSDKESVSEFDKMMVPVPEKQVQDTSEIRIFVNTRFPKVAPLIVGGSLEMQYDSFNTDLEKIGRWYKLKND